jgi:predicted RNA-binding protein
MLCSLEKYYTGSVVAEDAYVISVTHSRIERDDRLDIDDAEVE